MPSILANEATMLPESCPNGSLQCCSREDKARVQAALLVNPELMLVPNNTTVNKLAFSRRRHICRRGAVFIRSLVAIAWSPTLFDNRPVKLVA